MLAIALALAVAACGGGGGGSAATPSAPVTAADEVKFVVDYLKDWYLWYGQLPGSIDPNAYATPEAALAALRVTQDRYSYIDSATTFNAFFDEGRALGYGFGYSIVGSDLWIRYVQPNSNAAASGLRRGDRITAIDGTATSTLIAQGTVDAALGPVTEGVTGSFQLARAGATLTIGMTKGWYTLANVLTAQVIDQPGGKVGYLLYLSFTEPSRGEWLNALSGLLQAGAQDLVVDLRENGGGRLAVANDLASSLAPAGQQGSIGTQLQFNDRHPGSNQAFTLAASPYSGQARRLVWITSERTCSAAESLMTSLRPYEGSTTVGQLTCGKPVGFTPTTFNNKVYSVVTFRNLNRDGYTDYFSGLAPDCTVGEDFTKPYGDPTEPKLAAALQWLAGAGCPVADSGSAASKAAADRSGMAQGAAQKAQPATPARITGLPGLTGLY